MVSYQKRSRLISATGTFWSLNKYISGMIRRNVFICTIISVLSACSRITCEITVKITNKIDQCDIIRPVWTILYGTEKVYF